MNFYRLIRERMVWLLPEWFTIFICCQWGWQSHQKVKSMERISSAVAFFFVLCIGTDVVDASDENLIKNGDFEVGQLIGWNSGSSEPVSAFLITEAKKFSGKKALCISTAGKPADAWLTQTVTVKPNTYYRFSAQCAVESVTVGKVGANIGIMYTWNCAGSMVGTRPWTSIDLNFKTHPKQNQVSLDVRLGMWGSTVTGKAWFDDVTLTQLKSAPLDYISLSSPADQPQSPAELRKATSAAAATASRTDWASRHPLESIIIACLAIIFGGALIAFITEKRESARNITSR